jgi:spermidine synthase
VNPRRPAGGPAAACALFSFGFFPLFAQALLFRDFLSQFEGHEFGIGCFFGSWLLWLGAGALVARWLRGDVSALARGFPYLLLAYLPAFLAQHQALLSARQFAGVLPYEVFPLHKVIWASALANAPVSFVTGLLFPIACVWMSRARLPLAAVYAVEALGGFAGGLLATLLLAAEWRAESMFMLAAAELSVTALACHRGWKSPGFAASAALALALASAWEAGLPARWSVGNDRRAWERRLPGGEMSGRFATGQSVYLFGTYRGQFNVLANESICESVPEAEHASEIAALHLAQKPDARSVLVIGASSYPLCARLLSAGRVERVAWAHPDPDFPARFAAVLPAPPGARDPRLQIVGEEVRSFLRGSGSAFDLIVVNLPDATSLVLNRYFTDEFFRIAKQGLAPGGVLGVRVSGGENFLGGDLVQLGASVYSGLRATFARLAIKPGDETWLLASDEAPVTSDAVELLRRYRDVEGREKLYPAEGLPQLFLPDRVAFQLKKYNDALARVDPVLLSNTDESPRSMLNSLIVAGRQAGVGPRLGHLVRAFTLRGFRIVAIGALLLGVLRLVYVTRARGAASPAGTAPYDTGFLILTTGFAGMASSVVLMFHFQVRFGALQLYVGLLSALFMLGLYAGSELARRWLATDVSRSRRYLPWMLLGHAAFLAAVARAPEEISRPVFYALFLLAGLFTGGYVPVAAVWLKSGRATGDRESGSAFILLDNVGGAAGGLAAALLLLPTLGADLTLFASAALLGLNMLAGLRQAPHGASIPPRDAFDRMTHSAAYVLTGVAVFWMASSLILRGAPVEQREDPLAIAARALAPQAVWKAERREVPGAAAIEYLAGKVDETNEVFAFRTAPLARNVRGYGGRMDLAVALDGDGRIAGVRIVKSRETPAYLARVKPWMDSLRGVAVLEGGLPGRVDGVSGATVTSKAVLEAIDQASLSFAKALGKDAGGVEAARRPARQHIDTGAAVVLLLAFAAWVARTQPTLRMRRLLLTVAAVVAGIHLNAQYSLDQAFSLFALEVPAAGLNLPFVMVVGVPLIVLLFGNVYCGYMCPFGGLQELLGDLLPSRFRQDPDKQEWRYARAVKFGVLFVLVIWFGAGMQRELASGDPLVTAFSSEGVLRPSWLVAALLALAFVYRRFWCRALCPAGAFLSLLGGVRLLRRWLPAVHPKRCEFGVRGVRDLDCLQCDRCRIRGSRGEEEADTHVRPARAWLYLGAVIVVLVALGGSFRAASEGETGLGGAAEVRPSGARPADERAIRALIEQRRLSEREAMFYKPYTPDEEP